MRSLIIHKDMSATQPYCLPPIKYKHVDTLAWRNTYTFKKEDLHNKVNLADPTRCLSVLLVEDHS